ncbi:MAG: hypothetical protein NTY19_03180 [Planctomycetota bacterium]|nr:hypothetical protein [Planctomycetota bacterium]
MNEAETRAEHIAPALAAVGWGVVEGTKNLREYPITPRPIEGHGKRGNPDYPGRSVGSRAAVSITGYLPAGGRFLA